MRMILLAVMVWCAAFVAPVPAAAVSRETLELASKAVSPDTEVSEPAIRAIRDLGDAGLQSLMAIKTDNPYANARLNAAIDAVAQQRDARFSNLYWHTDLSKARAASEAEHKPILSLRLLGKLTDEFSCANSRFFRTALYANKEVSQYLRENFVLHWETVRPVPKVTIDMGDGRRIECTLTGNSAHYVLDPQGRPVDVIPGLYGPRAFLAALQPAHDIAYALAGTTDADRAAKLVEHHKARATVATTAFANDLSAIGYTAPPPAAQPQTSAPNAEPKRANPPTALEAAPRAMSKRGPERPILVAITPERAPAVVDAALPKLDDAAWSRLAARRMADAKLDDASIQLIRRQHPAAEEAASAAIAKSKAESPLIRMVRQFERNIALDTVRNEYLFHRTIHGWFAAGDAQRMSLAQLNERVYAELFLTPSSDPWLGLVAPDTYTALQNNGLSKAGK